VVPADAGDIELPLKPILEKLPPDIREKLTMPIENLGDASMSIPASQILPQLAGGVIRMEFGQLRGAASSLFNIGGEFDSIAITLPLDVVLSRLNRRMLARDPAQKKMDSAKEIGSVFLRRSDVIASPAPAPKPAAPAPSTETQIRLKMPTAPPAGTTTPRLATPPPAQPAPTAPIRPTTPLPPPSMPAPAAMKPAAPLAPPAPKPAPAPAPIPSSIPFPTAPKPASAAPPAAPDPEPNILTVPLAAVMDKWPEALRNEIAQRSLSNSRLALPMGALEDGMKRGIVTMFWRDARSSLRPPVTEVSIHDGVALELPLKVIAPLFVAKHAAIARPRANVALDQSIPNVFGSDLAPKAEPAAPAPVLVAPAPVTPPVAPAPALKMAPRPVAPITPIAPVAPAAPPASVSPVSSSAPAAPEESTGFAPRLGEPQGMDSSKRRPPTPTDLIRRTMDLKGVEGAMIVLHDGLMVASELPAYLNPETSAAFLPQIYDRLSQCISELRMGPLSHLRFNVGNVTWFVYRQPSVYFAVFGREGDLPSEPQLTALAAELDRNRQ
jgi:hypothetical protein